jgi:hypothetical protein
MPITGGTSLSTQTTVPERLASVFRENFRDGFRAYCFKKMCTCHLNRDFKERNSYCRALGMDVIKVFYLRPVVRDELN